MEEALRLLALGWQVVAAPKGGKLPTTSWKRYQTERVPERVVRASFGGQQNLFVITGDVSRLIVLDCDDEQSLKHWHSVLGEAIENTARVSTGKGYHFYFRVPDGQKAPRNRSVKSEESGDWDLRGEGGGVIAPPSIHESGRVYQWVEGHGPEAIVDAPRELLDWKPEGADDSGGTTRSMLAHLLANPPQEGGRNSWLAQVAGHYALHIPHRDAYEAMVLEAAGRCNPPLEGPEVEKLINSIWQTEQAKVGRAAPELEEGGTDDWRASLLEATEETGWLVSGGNRILVQVRTRDAEGNAELGLASWLDADIHVIGVVDTDQERVYNVDVHIGDQVQEGALPASTIADPRRLSTWLACFGVGIGVPDQMWPARMAASTRLIRYLEAQGAEAMEAAESLGWHEGSGAFITHEGVIRADGPGPFERVRPDPRVKGWAPYKYGHAGQEEARRVLSEVLTFHDETVAAVFGAWWAATLIKPRVSGKTSQFPFMALEATSESGKTTGFFSLMLQLSGNSSGQTNPTRAALRDYLCAHNSGIVWMDDLDDLETHGELLRNVTVGGSIVKKGHENHEQVVAHLQAALCVTGEGLGLHYQKALLDRAVLLEVPSPVGRKSVHGDYPQWDDVLALRDRHPDLTAFAGSIIELALANADDAVAEIKSLRVGTGRYADKAAILRAGARSLARLVGSDYDTDWIIELTDQWVESDRRENDRGAENVLTMRILPAALSRLGWPDRPYGPDPSRRTPMTPAFVTKEVNGEPESVWFSPTLLAEWWEREPGPTSSRTDTSEALEQQARALGLGGKKGSSADCGRRMFRLATGEGSKVYWRLTPELTDLVIKRSREDEDEEETEDGEDQRLL